MIFFDLSSTFSTADRSRRWWRGRVQDDFSIAAQLASESRSRYGEEFCAFSDA